MIGWNRTGACLLFAVLLAGPVACAVHAPAGQAAGGAAALERILERARDGYWHVRVTTSSGLLEGQVRTPAMGRVWIGETDTSLDAVSLVERRSSRRSGAWPGAIIGGVALGAAGWAVGGLEDNPRGEKGRQFITVTSFALGAVAGMLIGRKLVPGRADWVTVWSTEH